MRKRSITVTINVEQDETDTGAVPMDSSLCRQGIKDFVKNVEGAGMGYRAVAAVMTVDLIECAPKLVATRIIKGDDLKLR